MYLYNINHAVKHNFLIVYSIIINKYFSPIRCHLVLKLIWLRFLFMMIAQKAKICFSITKVINIYFLMCSIYNLWTGFMCARLICIYLLNIPFLCKLNTFLILCSALNKWMWNYCSVLCSKWYCHFTFYFSHLTFTSGYSAWTPLLVCRV